jgi:hypothetical protein
MAIIIYFNELTEAGYVCMFYTFTGQHLFYVIFYYDLTLTHFQHKGSQTMIQVMERASKHEAI